MTLSPGIYEQVVDESLLELLRLATHLREHRLDPDNEQYVDQLVNHLSACLASILKSSSDNTQRASLVNEIIGFLSRLEGQEYLSTKRLSMPPEVLAEVLTESDARSHLPRTASPLASSTLYTGSANDPSLDNELRQEMCTADRVDMLVSFVKWSGLRLLMPGLEDLEHREIPVRLITTSYLGASDPKAIEWLAGRKNTELRISYDTQRTRLHAKAYLFHRKSGFDTAYIGSSNISQPAMTSGLEWNLKVTRRDLHWIVERFTAEFESYWNSAEFESWDAAEPERFRNAINQCRAVDRDTSLSFFADIEPYAYQSRILEQLDFERNERDSWRNLVIAATGTGKTVISALDYRRECQAENRRLRLLFVAHRSEILHQSRDCFRAVLRDANFAELLTGTESPGQYDYLFATVQTVNSMQLWERLPADYYDYIILDEAHHGAASSYRGLLEQFTPKIFLGLTATPERMDGESILPDFNDRFAAEIRLPEALEEKLLCPFHYFGVTDPVSLADDRYWSQGRYQIGELEKVYIDDNMQANQRLDAVVSALKLYVPDLASMRAVGFCVSIRHAQFMAQALNSIGVSAEALVSHTSKDERARIVSAFREGRLQILFTVDLLSEGFDLPEIDVVMFLRPTESLTIFLQQLGRGLRHANGKECLTVLDFVGQSHRKYSIARKFSALLPARRYRIDSEVEQSFPHLPPGCSILLEKQAAAHVIANIKAALGNLKHYVTETYGDLSVRLQREPTIAEFAHESVVDMSDILSRKSWSEWRAIVRREDLPADPDMDWFRPGMASLSVQDAPAQIDNIQRLLEGRGGLTDKESLALHVLLTRKHPNDTGIADASSLANRLYANPSVVDDIGQLIEWRKAVSQIRSRNLDLHFECPLVLHSSYGLEEIKALMGFSDWSKVGSKGVGVLHDKERKIYYHLVTFQKDEKDFVPTTMYNDYPISPTLLHWESQSRVSSSSPTAKNYRDFDTLGYTILFFARLRRSIGKVAAPYIFLGPAESLVSCEGERPLRMVWQLQHAMPAALFEQAQRGG